MERIFIFGSSEDQIKNDDKELFFVNSLSSYSLKDDDIFISYNYKTPLHLRLEYPSIPSESLVISTSDTNIEKLLKETKNNFDNDYKIFSGEKIKSAKKGIKLIILKNLKLLSVVMQDMMNAGYLERKNIKKIPDWIISFEHPILKLLIVYHKITTSNESIPVEEEFLINPQFREMILTMIMKILANFIINNNFSSIEDVSKIGDWNKEETWNELRKTVKFLKI